MAKYVDLSERVTATYYDDEHEEWSQKTVTIAEVLDSVCDDYTVLPSAQPEIIRCKDCKHFEYDHAYVIQGVPILGHEVCNAWGDGCKTDENGWCFLAERRTDETDLVDLSERVTATYYDDEHEEWSQKTVTIRDLLDGICDEYTVLSSAQPEQAVKDCRNCKHGKYNDYHDTYFCYNPENCSNWDKWETSEQPERKNRLISEIEGKTPEETYDFLAWLLLGYGRQFTDTRQAIIQWLASQPDCGADMR